LQSAGLDRLNIQLEEQVSTQNPEWAVEESDSLTTTVSCFVSTQRNSDRKSFALSDMSEILCSIRQYLHVITGTIDQLSNKPLSLHGLTPSADIRQSSMVSCSLSHPSTYHPINSMLPFEEDFMCA
jgi:hypothetical protein